MNSVTPNETMALSLSLEPSERNLVEQAASLSGQDINHFARNALLDKARDVVHPESVRVLSRRDAIRFVELLDSEVEPNEALRRAADRYQAHHE